MGDLVGSNQITKADNEHVTKYSLLMLLLIIAVMERYI